MQAESATTLPTFPYIVNPDGSIPWVDPKGEEFTARKDFREALPKALEYLFSAVQELPSKIKASPLEEDDFRLRVRHIKRTYIWLIATAKRTRGVTISRPKNWYREFDARCFEVWHSLFHRDPFSDEELVWSWRYLQSDAFNDRYRFWRPLKNSI